MSARAPRRENGAGTAALVVVTTIVAVAAIGAAAFGVWFVLTH